MRDVCNQLAHQVVRKLGRSRLRPGIHIFHTATARPELLGHCYIHSQCGGRWGERLVVVGGVYTLEELRKCEESRREGKTMRGGGVELTEVGGWIQPYTGPDGS